MKKTALLLLPMAVSMLVGCTNTNRGEYKGDIEITFWHTFGDKPETALEGKVAKFIELVKKEEGVDVKVTLSYQGAYKDMPQKVITGLATGDMPSIAIAYPDHVAQYMAQEGSNPGKYVVNFDTYLKDEAVTFGTDKYLGDNEKESDMVKSYMDEGREFQREGTYLIPLMKSTEIMCYNLSAVKAAMSHIHPEIATDKVKEYMKTITWEQLLEIAAECLALKGTEVSSNLDYPIYYDSDSNLFITDLYQNQVAYSSIGSDGVGKIDFEEPTQLTAAKNLVKDLKDAADAHLLTTKGVQGTYASNAFKNVETIFSIGSTGGTGYTIPDAGSFEVAFAKVPTMGSRLGYISQGPSVCFLKNPSWSQERNDATLKYSWKLIKYLTSKQVNVSLCVTGSEGYSPVRNSCYTTETYNDFIDAGESYAEAALVTQNDIAGHYLNTAVFTGSATLRNEVGALITSVLGGKASIDDAFATAINNTKKDIQ